MSKASDRNASNMATLSSQILNLIHAKCFDQAEEMIATALTSVPADEQHRLLWLSATLEDCKGNLP